MEKLDFEGQKKSKFILKILKRNNSNTKNFGISIKIIK